MTISLLKLRDGVKSVGIGNRGRRKGDEGVWKADFLLFFTGPISRFREAGAAVMADSELPRSTRFVTRGTCYSGTCKVPTIPEGISRNPKLNPVVPGGVFTLAPSLRP
jgi:hypothetical protein